MGCIRATPTLLVLALLALAGVAAAAAAGDKALPRKLSESFSLRRAAARARGGLETRAAAQEAARAATAAVGGADPFLATRRVRSFRSMGFEVEAVGGVAPVESEADAAGLGTEEVLPHTGSEAEIRRHYGRERKAARGRIGIELFDGVHAYALRGSAASDRHVATAVSGHGWSSSPAASTAESFVEAGARAGKLVGMGTPNRRLAKKETRVAPAATVGRLHITKAGKGYRCTGTLIGKRAVLTAAHCVASRKTNKVVAAKDIRFVPASSGRKDEPFGRLQASSVAFAKGYLKKNTKEAEEWMGLDLAVVCLKEDAAAKVGGYTGFVSRPFRTFADSRKHRLRILSYPAKTLGGVSMFRDVCQAMIIKKNYDLALHYCDTEGGSSGAAILAPVGAGGARAAIGVHRGACSGKCNMFTQLAKDQYDFVRNSAALCGQ